MTAPRTTGGFLPAAIVRQDSRLEDEFLAGDETAACEIATEIGHPALLRDALGTEAQRAKALRKYREMRLAKLCEDFPFLRAQLASLAPDFRQRARRGELPFAEIGREAARIASARIAAEAKAKDQHKSACLRTIEKNVLDPKPWTDKFPRLGGVLVRPGKPLCFLRNQSQMKRQLIEGGGGLLLPVDIKSRHWIWPEPAGCEVDTAGEGEALDLQ